MASWVRPSANYRRRGAAPPTPMDLYIRTPYDGVSVTASWPVVHYRMLHGFSPRHPYFVLLRTHADMAWKARAQAAYPDARQWCKAMGSHRLGTICSATWDLARSCMACGDGQMASGRASSRHKASSKTRRRAWQDSSTGVAVGRGHREPRYRASACGAAYRVEQHEHAPTKRGPHKPG